MISPLQLGLIGLGAVFILGLVMFNWWQERKIRRDMVRRFDGPIDDVLMKRTPDGANTEQEVMIPDDNHVLVQPESTQEFEAEAEFDEPEFIIEDDVEFSESPDEGQYHPELMPHHQPDAEPEHETGDREPSPAPLVLNTDEETAKTPASASSAMAGASAGSAPPVDPLYAVPLPAAVDVEIDEITLLVPAETCTGSLLRSHINPWAGSGKPGRWFGWSDNAWLPLTREYEQNEFSRVIGALQLADRSGPVQADDLLKFQDQIEHLGTRIGGSISWYAQREALRYANELDQFCIAVDVTVTLHVTAGVEGPFAGTKLRGIAEAAGLLLRDDGRYHYLNDNGESLYTLSSADQRPITESSLRTAMMHDVVLMLDVPRVNKGGEVFRQMAMFGARLETALNARLTDANRRALGETEIEQIRSQIQMIHNKMQEHRITPGSDTALRLFS